MAEQSYGDWIRSNPPLPTKKYKKQHMAQRTAVEDLIIALQKFVEHDGVCPDTIEAAIEFAENRLEMEKQQHGNTWDAAIKAHDDRGHVHARSLVDFDEWYNETYKTT